MPLKPVTVFADAEDVKASEVTDTPNVVANTASAAPPTMDQPWCGHHLSSS
jgi:hypothetical protein